MARRYVLSRATVHGSDGVFVDVNVMRWFDATRVAYLLVHGPSATFPVVDVPGITEMTYSYLGAGAVIAANQNGWTWTVQAQVNGVYRTWSPAGTFNVLP